jgi:hypothetical protein
LKTNMDVTLEWQSKRRVQINIQSSENLTDDLILKSLFVIGNQIATPKNILVQASENEQIDCNTRN